MLGCCFLIVLALLNEERLVKFVVSIGVVLLLFSGYCRAKPIAAIHFKDAALARCIKNNAIDNHWQNSEQFTKLKCHGKGITQLDDLVNFRPCNRFCVTASFK